LVELAATGRPSPREGQAPGSAKLLDGGRPGTVGHPRESHESHGNYKNCEKGLGWASGG